jgi:protocatechuate 3,4-dioxygenase, beta subunit
MDLSRRTAIVRVGTVGALALLSPSSALAALRPTPRAIKGPFYPLALPPERDSDLSLLQGRRRALGELIEVSGRLLDIRGNPLGGALVEIWQANAAGRYAHRSDPNPAPLDPNFQGYGQLRTDRGGHYRFLTIRPGAYPIGDGAPPRPPHIHVQIAASTGRLVTQMIFPGEPLNATDAVIAAADRERLTARGLGTAAGGARRFGWDIVVA